MVAGGFGSVRNGDFGGGLEPGGLLRQPLGRLLGICLQHAISFDRHTSHAAGRAGTWSSHQIVVPNPSTNIAVPSAAGRYVRVQLSGTDYLTLSEVQIF